MRWGTQWPWNASDDIALIDIVQRYWINFARTGNPNGAGLPEWPMFARSGRAMELGDPVRAIDWPDAAEHRLQQCHVGHDSARGPQIGHVRTGQAAARRLLGGTMST